MRDADGDADAVGDTVGEAVAEGVAAELTDGDTVAGVDAVGVPLQPAAKSAAPITLMP